MTLTDSRVYAPTLEAFFYDRSLKPEAPPLFSRSKPAFEQRVNGQQGYVLAVLSAQWLLRNTRQSMNLHSSKRPTDSLSEVSH